MSNPLSVEIKTVMPEHASIVRVLDKADANAPGKRLTRSFQRTFPDWEWHLVSGSGTWHSVKVAVIDIHCQKIAADAQLWMDEQRTLLGEHRLIDRLKNEGIKLARYEGAYLYFVGIDPQKSLEFIQVTVEHKRRAICSLHEVQRWHLRERPDSHPFPWDRSEHLALEYHCPTGSVINSLSWLERSKISHRAICEDDRAQMERRAVTRSFPGGDAPITLSFVEAFPNAIAWANRPSREERWFRDWSASSASKHELGRFWYLETHDYVHKDGLHHVGFVPQAVRWPKQKIRLRKLSAFQLAEKLARFDRIVGHQFSWYFYMVHGNRITSAEGKAMAEAIRVGSVHLEPRDEAVLMAWAENPYGF